MLHLKEGLSKSNKPEAMLQQAQGLSKLMHAFVPDIPYLYGPGYNAPLYPPEPWIQWGPRVKWNSSNHPDTPLYARLLGYPGYPLYPIVSEDQPKVEPKSRQSRPKVGPKSVQSWSKVGPKSAQSRPKVGPKSAQSRAQVGPKSGQSR